MSQFYYEILLGSDFISPEKWQSLFVALRNYLGWNAKWQIYLYRKSRTLRFFLVTPKSLPSNLGFAEFLFKPNNEPPFIVQKSSTKSFNFRADSLPLIFHRLSQQSQSFDYLFCDFSSFGHAIFPRCFLATHPKTQNPIIRKTSKLQNLNPQKSSISQNFLHRLVVQSPAQLFSLDFSAHKNLRYQKIPKSLDCAKIFSLARAKSERPLLSLETFPYAAQKSFLELSDFDFAKHSLVIGGSGSGKSRFLALFITRLYQSSTAKNHKIIVIDPHDALKNDLGEIESQRIVDFRAPERSVDLFHQNLDNLNVNVELMLETFRTMIGDNYNGRLERVLRHAIYILLLDANFSFSNLRRLLSNLEFRHALLVRLNDRLPENISHFFLTEFQELRSSSYNLAFAPIIALIDEMEMLPAMNQSAKLANLDALVAENFLTLFSLNRLALGDRPTRIISGFLLQQIFLFAQNRSSSEHLIIIIDEVAIVEHPILARFLSESRKFHVSIILAGQYFGQISPELRAGILANTQNYFIFRVSRADAALLRENLQLKILGEHKIDDEYKFFTGLRARECLAQINRDGEIFPLFKARTPDYSPPENRVYETSSQIITNLNQEKLMNFDFQNLADQIFENALGVKNNFSLDEIQNLFAFDLNLPVAVKDATTGETTYSIVPHAPRHMTCQNISARDRENGWMMSPRKFKNLDEIISAWHEINFLASERIYDCENVVRSDPIYNSLNIYASTNCGRSKNLLFCDGIFDSEFALACRRSANLNFCLRVDDSNNCTNSFAVVCSGKISNSLFIQNSSNLHECLFCSHISDQSFCIANVQFDRAEYFQIKAQVIKRLLTNPKSML